LFAVGVRDLFGVGVGVVVGVAVGVRDIFAVGAVVAAVVAVAAVVVILFHVTL
jgi:hypothetical protein